jgi:predicted nucleotidyltransferase
LLSLTGPLYSDDHSEEDRIISAISDFVDDPIMDHDYLDFRASSTRRIPTVKLFDDFESLEDLVQETDRRAHKNELPAPLNKKRNNGRKISLDAADRLFTGFREQLSRLEQHEEFGFTVPLVLVFGSYFRREPEVGDLDIAVLTMRRSNWETRREQLAEAGKSGTSFFDYIGGPEKEVLQFLKNRSSWIGLHDLSGLVSLADLRFEVVHCSPAFQPLVDRFQREELTGNEFIRLAEKLKSELISRVG